MPDPHSIRADLNDPLYYLRNAFTLIDWVCQRHADLLDTHEWLQLERFRSVSEPAQALLVRMVMRRGDHFRSDQLSYDELPKVSELLTVLADAELVELDPELNSHEISALLRKPELLSLCQSIWQEDPPARPARKQDLQARLIETVADSRPFSHWLPDADFEVVRLKIGPLMDRLRLMFFGNLYQDWSEFVITELGHQRYELVPFEQASRAFQTRDEVDAYLHLAQLQQQLEADANLPELIAQLPTDSPNEWLEHRRRKLAFAIGQAVEKSGETELARGLYGQNPYPEAQLRHLRLMELWDAPMQTFQQAQQLLTQTRRPEARIRIQRILYRSGKKCGQDVAQNKRKMLPEQTLSLAPEDGLRVEALVIKSLESQGFQATHVENSLFNGLFALLFWPAIYAPVSGAFFHPFQSGPADLYHPDFFLRREKQVNEQLAFLYDQRYRQVILERYQQKQGTSCSLINWSILTMPLVEQALTMIPAHHLEAIFHYLMLDLRQHRRGMPDLICFDSKRKTYQLIEVKGPGDRLQDHQRLWLEFFMDTGIPATLCQVHHV